MPTEKAHGIQLAKMCEAFLERGVSLELVVPRRASSSQSLKSFYGLRRDIPVKKLWVFDFYLHGRFGYVAGSFSFAIAYFCYLFAKRLQGESFLVYTTDIDQFSFFLIPFIGAPYCAEIHDAKQRKFPFTYFFRRAQGLIVINRIIKEKLCERFKIPPEHIIVHPNGIDLAVFHLDDSIIGARKKLGLPQDKKIILYIGKCYNWKGLHTFVDAAELLQSDASLFFYLVGDTQQNLKKAISRELLPSSVHCVAHQEIKEIPLWLSASNVRVALGTKGNEYSYYHTSPMKLFEYMAIPGRAIVAAKTPAIGEIVSEEQVYFYQPDDANDLAEKILYALEHSQESVMRSQKAFEHVKEFTWDLRAKSIVQFMGFTL